MRTAVYIRVYSANHLKPCSELLIWSEITVKSMVSDELDTSGMIKWGNVITSSNRSARISPIVSGTCTNFGLSCFRHPVNSCQKSPNQPWQGPVKVLKYHQLYQLLAHVPGKALSDAQSILAKIHRPAINRWVMICDLTVVEPCWAFLWLICTYSIWFSITVPKVD